MQVLKFAEKTCSGLIRPRCNCNLSRFSHFLGYRVIYSVISNTTVLPGVMEIKGLSLNLFTPCKSMSAIIPSLFINDFDLAYTKLRIIRNGDSHFISYGISRQLDIAIQF